MSLEGGGGGATGDMGFLKGEKKSWHWPLELFHGRNKLWVKF